MSANHVIVRPAPSSRPLLAPLAGFLDIVVDGLNITARIGETQSFTLLSELAHALTTLSSGRRCRSTVQVYAKDQAWEIGLETDGPSTLLTVFRGGVCPEVAVHERRVETTALRRGVLEALDQALASKPPPNVDAFLQSARRDLERAPRPAKTLGRRLVQDRIEGAPAGGIRIGASACFRVGAPKPEGGAAVERSDLHALLVRGSLRIESGSRSITLERAPLVLLAERLLWMAEDVLDSWQAARPIFRRVHLDSVRLAIRRGPGESPVTLTVTLAAEDRLRSLSLSDLNAADFVEALADFIRALGACIQKHDATQQSNLRLLVLLENAALLRERLEDARADDELTNQEPDTYRSFGLPSVAPKAEGLWSEGGTMRFSPRWVAAVPHVDLRSTFLCGDRLVVGSSREVACLDPASGAIAWRVTSDRAATVATPLGVARLHGDGRLRMHDLATGAIRFVTLLEPRVGGGAAGALVNTPGLPRLLLVAEGERSVTAVDLVSGEVRWRYRSRRPSHFRLRRAGKLVLVSAGDSALQALDVSTGDVVWKLRDRLPFTGDIAVVGDSALAVCATASGGARLHHIDLWTGSVRWSAHLEDSPALGHVPLVAGGRVLVPTRDRRGVGVTAFDFESGRTVWEHAPGLMSAATSWLGFDEMAVANSASGTLRCLSAESGEILYSHVFSHHVEADQPRRLEPILRKGALFVPQHEVVVLRPRTGEIIGQVPSDLIPDLLQVDESCNLIVAEESGHLAAFSAGAQLRLVS